MDGQTDRRTHPIWSPGRQNDEVKSHHSIGNSFSKVVHFWLRTSTRQSVYEIGRFLWWLGSRKWVGTSEHIPERSGLASLAFFSCYIFE